MFGCLYTDNSGSIWHALVCKHVISVLASEIVRPNAAYTVMITTIIFLGGP